MSMNGEDGYKDVVEDLESEVENVEKDFESIKSDNPSRSLREKQDRAEEILGEIHEQLDFLKSHLDEIEGR